MFFRSKVLDTEACEDGAPKNAMRARAAQMSDDRRDRFSSAAPLQSSTSGTSRLNVNRAQLKPRNGNSTCTFAQWTLCNDQYALCADKAHAYLHVPTNVYN